MEETLGTIGAIIVALGLLCLLIWLGMLLWNSLIPELFNGPTVTYGQMFGLWALSVLFLKRGNIKDNK